MSELTANGLLPAEHRAYRELHATTRQLQRHWGRLARRIDDPEVLAEGASQAGALLAGLEQRLGATHDLHGRPSAQSVGSGLAGARGVSDLLLERNQAYRSALLDLQHVTTLLGYVAALARTRGEEPLATWLAGWEERFKLLEERGRAAVAALARDPDAATAPADETLAGRAGARVGVALGTVGEAIDHSPIGRLARRRDT
jgi:hypothetical protein